MRLFVRCQLSTHFKICSLMSRWHREDFRRWRYVTLWGHRDALFRRFSNSIGENRQKENSAIDNENIIRRVENRWKKSPSTEKIINQTHFRSKLKKQLVITTDMCSNSKTITAYEDGRFDRNEMKKTVEIPTDGRLYCCNLKIYRTSAQKS